MVVGREQTSMSPRHPWRSGRTLGHGSTTPSATRRSICSACTTGSSGRPSTPTGPTSPTRFTRLDDALLDWQAGDPDALLALPGHITALVEDRLSFDPSGRATRLRITRLAMDALDPRVWSSRIDDLIDELSGLQRAEAARYSAVCRIHAGDRDAAEPLVDEGSRDARQIDLLWLAARLIRFEEAELLGESSSGSTRRRRRRPRPTSPPCSGTSCWPPTPHQVVRSGQSPSQGLLRLTSWASSVGRIRQWPCWMAWWPQSRAHDRGAMAWRQRLHPPPAGSRSS